MYLSERQKILLREIYMIPPSTSIVIGGGSGVFYGEGLDAHDEDLTARINQAIAEIEINQAKSERVGEILSAYEEFALDWSKIDRDGYSFRPARNLRQLYRRLWPLTGIWIREYSSNITPLG